MYRTKTFIFKKLIDYVNQLKKRNYNYDIFEISFRKKRRQSIIMSISQISKTDFRNQKYQQYQSFLFSMSFVSVQFQLFFQLFIQLFFQRFFQSFFQSFFQMLFQLFFQMSFQLSVQLSSQLSFQLSFQQLFQSSYRSFQSPYQSSRSKNEQQHFSSNMFSSKLQRSEYDYEHKLSIIIKLYTNEKKYNEINDNFVFKINVFQNICNRAMLFVKTQLLTFSIMFKKWFWIIIIIT